MTKKQELREAANAANIASWGRWESYKTHKGARGYEVKVGMKAIAQHCLKVDSVFIATANPATVLALLDEISELEQRHCGTALLEREETHAKTVGRLMDELEEKDKRIAELEAREVVLPQRISMEGGSYCTAHARYDEEGDFYYRDEVIESLVAAGIITRIED